MRKLHPCPFALLLMLLPFFAVAQPVESREMPRYQQLGIRTNPLSWADPDGNVLLGINYRWSKRWSVTVDPAWVFFRIYTFNGRRSQPSGFKLGSDLRYHFGRGKAISFFAGPQFLFKKTSTERNTTFGINCQNGNCAYFQEAKYTDLKKETGGALQAGLVTNVNKSGRLCLEAFLGLGVKHLKFKEIDIPVGGSFITPPPRGPFVSGADRNSFYAPHIPGGLRLMWFIN